MIPSKNSFPAFNEVDPFPLLPLELAEHLSAKEHSKNVDEWLGFQIEKVETQVRADRFSEALAPFETWSHISPHVFLTPYTELRYWLEKLAPQNGSTICDLGAGYGRLAFVIERHFPNVNFIGLECVPARVAEFKRVALHHNLIHSQMKIADLTNHKEPIPAAEIYFIYDCGSRDDVQVVVDRLSRQSEAGTKLLVRGLRACQILRDSSHWSASPDFDYRQAPGLHAEIFIKL